MNLSMKEYYNAIHIMRTVDDCRFSEQYFEARDVQRDEGAGYGSNYDAGSGYGAQGGNDDALF